MGESENKPSIHIHLDQQVTIEAVKGQEDVEDATVATEITGFDVEQDLYVLRGALSFTGFLRQEDSAEKQLQIPDEFDGRDVFETAEEVAEAPVLPFHYRLPFILQVPVAAQQAHQREAGILSVNPRIGQWNVHVLGPETLHLRAELVIQGLSGSDGYVFRCGSQEEGAVSKLDHLLDQEEARAFATPNGPDLAGEEFEAPFAPWPEGAANAGEGALYEEQRQLHELADSAGQEDDWVIETPRAEQQAASEKIAETADSLHDDAEPDGEEEERQIIFTPDPSLFFPMPEPGSEWARELEAADRAFGQSEQEPAFFKPPTAFPSALNSLSAQVPPVFDPPLAGTFPHPWADFSRAANAEGAEEAEQAQQAEEEVRQPEAADAEVSDDEAFVVEFEEETRELDEQANESFAFASAFENAAKESSAQSFAEQTEEFRADLSDQASDQVIDSASDQADEDQAVESVVSEASPSEVERAEAEGTALADAEAALLSTEYEFEDEVPPQETEAVAEPDVLEKPFAPKLSFGSKPTQPTAGSEPIKLSQFFGDSRTEAPTETTAYESQSFAESAQLVRESLSSYGELQAVDEDSSAESLTLATESASITTSAKGHSKESFWREILNGHDEKVTMKFRIVQEEESLPMLAEQYHTTINDLLRANNLQRQEVEAGQILYIPARKR